MQQTQFAAPIFAFQVLCVGFAAVSARCADLFLPSE